MNAEDINQMILSVSKAGAYDAIKDHYTELQEENVKLKQRVKFLEELINEYTLKMKSNLSGSKVDQFLKDQISETDKEIEQEFYDYKNSSDDLKEVNI